MRTNNSKIQLTRNAVSLKLFWLYVYCLIPVIGECYHAEDIWAACTTEYFLLFLLQTGKKKCQKEYLPVMDTSESYVFSS